VQDVVEVLDRRVGDGMVLVVRVRSADPVQVEPGGAGALPEVGVLAAVADVRLAEAADTPPGGCGDREGERPEEAGVAAGNHLVVAWHRPSRVRNRVHREVVRWIRREIADSAA
jgi:hypothetical protein